MRPNLIFPALIVAISATRLAAQSAPVTIPPGNYLLEARDTSKAGQIGIAGWPFALKGNGTFTMTSPDSLIFAGKMEQKDGMVTYTDQTCEQPGVYYVREARGGYVLDLKSEACTDRDAGLVKLLFLPIKPKR